MTKVILFLIFIPALTNAEETLSWNKCAEIASQNNRSLKAKKAAVEESSVV
ncbi:MAG: hypothetical protein HY746_09995 [Elusimicrobia bacterium]|nr:hypothetical protein [Elusimicrobiota bacterium]